MAVTAELDLEIAKFRAGFQQAVQETRKFESQANKVGVDIGKQIAAGIKSELSGALFGNIISTLGIGGGIGAGVAAIKSSTSFFRDLELNAQKLGVSAEELQRIGPIAAAAKTSIDQLGNSLLKLEKSLGNGEDPKLAGALQRLGLDAGQLQSMPIDQKILALADAFQKGRAEGTGMHDVAQLLGKSFADLIPVLSQNTDKLREMMGAVKPVDDATVAMMARVDEMQERASKSVMKKGRGFLGRLSVGFEAGWNLLTGNTGKFLNEEGKAAEEGVNQDSEHQQNRTLMGRLAQLKQAGDVDRLERFAQVMDQTGHEGFAELARQAAALIVQFQKLSENHDIAGLKSFAETARKQGDHDFAARADVIRKEEEERKEMSKRIVDYETRLRQAALATMSEGERLAAMEEQHAALMQQKNQTGGVYFANTNEGLRAWADKLKQMGNLEEAERVLKMLEEALRLTREMDALTKHMHDTAAKEAEEAQKKLEHLREGAARGELQEGTPVQQGAQHIANLQKLFEGVVKQKPGESFGAYVQRGLDQIKKQASDAHAKGDTAGETKALTRLDLAQKEARELAGGHFDRRSPMGALGGQINALLGKSHSEMIADHTKQMVTFLEKIDHNIAELAANGLSKQQVAQAQPSPWIVDNGLFTN